jgi:hypothetical protein
MLIVQCDTSRFRSGPRNGFKCVWCDRLVKFPMSCTSVIIIAFSKSFTVVHDAETGHTLHDCRVPPKALIDFGAMTALL